MIQFDNKKISSSKKYSYQYWLKFHLIHLFEIIIINQKKLDINDKKK